MKNRNRTKKQQLRILFFKLLFIFILLVAVVIYMDAQIRPVVNTFSKYQATAMATQTINTVVANELMNLSYDYEDFTEIVYSDNQMVSSLHMNTPLVNQFKSKVTVEILKQLYDMEKQAVSIPIGNLIGNQFLAGRGPKVTFKMMPTGVLNTNIKNNFQSVGINQVLHQIFLNVSVEITTILPGYTNVTQIETTVPIAETIIVGVVPDTFLGLNDNGNIADNILQQNSLK